MCVLRLQSKVTIHIFDGCSSFCVFPLFWFISTFVGYTQAFPHSHVLAESQAVGWSDPKKCLGP